MVRGGPLLELEPGLLAPPPDAGAVAEPRGLLGRAVVLVLLLLGLPLLGVLVTITFVALNVASFRMGRLNVPLLLAALAVPLSLGRAFLALVRPMPEAPGEIEVPEAEEPGLYAEARRLAAAAGTRPPDRIVLVPLVNAYVSECGPLLGFLRGRRTLAIGAPLLDALTVSELRAVLGHEFGHFTSGDTRLGPLAYRTEVALEEIVRTLRGFSGTVFFAYYLFQYRVGAALRQGQEVVADRVAVQVAGRQAAADALRKVAVAAVLDTLHMHSYLRPLLLTGHRPPDLASGYRALLASPARVAWAAALPEVDDDPYTSHPCTDVRVRRIEALPDIGPARPDDRAASVLFADPERWVRATHEHWLLLAASSLELEPVSWEAWPDLVLEPEQRRLARDLDIALADLALPAGVAGVRQALETGRGSELSAALLARGWRCPGVISKADVLRAAVVAATSTQAVAQGSHRWALSWDAAAALVTADGEDVRLDERVMAAVDDGDWSGLDELLAETALAARRRRRGRVAAQAAGDGATGAATDVLVETLPRRLEDIPAPPVPQAPTPPFQAVGDGGWRAVLRRPAVFTRRTVLTILPSGIDTGRARVDFDDVVSVRLELLRQYTAMGFRLRLTTRDGRKVMVTTGGWRGERRAAITATYDYLYWLFTATVAPRRRREIVEALQAGETVDVAGLVLSPEGVAKRKRFARWADVKGPVGVKRGHLRFTFGAHRQAVSVDATDAYLLPDLFPLLRAMFGG